MHFYLWTFLVCHIFLVKLSPIPCPFALVTLSFVFVCCVPGCTLFTHTLLELVTVIFICDYSAHGIDHMLLYHV